MLILTLCTLENIILENLKIVLSVGDDKLTQ